jgi:cytochrome P450
MNNSPDQTLLNIKIQTTPEEFSRYLRERGNVYWWDPGNFFIVTDYPLAEVVLKGGKFSADRSAFFISRMPNLDLNLVPDFFSVVKKMMVMSDPPQHTARRKIAGTGLADDLMDNFKPTVEKTVTELLDRAAGKTSFEFFGEVAQPLPSEVLADLFFIEPALRKNFYQWSNNMTQFFGGASLYRNEDGVEVNHSAAQIRNYFTGLIAERRKNPREDFLSVLLKFQSSLGLDDSEVVSQAIMMLVAGQVTTTDQMCNNLFQLLSVPEALDRVKASPPLLEVAIEEFTRLDPAVTFMFRVAAEDIKLGPCEIKKGDVVFISTHAVNRDPRVFEMPDRCLFDRPKNPHMAYGQGPHFCLGARLARIQMSALFGQMIKRFPNLSLDPTHVPLRKHHSLAFSGFESLWVQH